MNVSDELETVENLYPELESGIAQKLEDKTDYWISVEKFYNDISESRYCELTEGQAKWLNMIVVQLDKAGLM